MILLVMLSTGFKIGDTVGEKKLKVGSKGALIDKAWR